MTASDVASGRTPAPRRTGVTAVALGVARAVLWPVLLLIIFLALVVATNGLAYGWVACLGAVAVTAALALWLRSRRRGRPTRWAAVVTTVAMVVVVAAVCVPTVPVERRLPPDVSAQLGGRSMTWTLPSGSQVAVYHYPADPGTPRRPVPLLYLHGGPIRSLSLVDHRFLAGFAARGYDVWLYEQPGAGRSGLLPGTAYGVERELTDLNSVIDQLGAGPVDVIGFSAGGSLLARALADPDNARRIHRAVVAEMGPMDGPTAVLTGPAGEPNAGGLAPAGERGATASPRYATALGLMMLGVLPQDNGLVGQEEMLNAFTKGDLGADAARAYCAKDAGRIPVEDVPGGFTFNAVGSLRVQRTIRESPGLAPALRRSATPTMVLVAECSSQVRAWHESFVASNPAVDRVQRLPGVGHRLWNGLDDNDERAYAVVTAYLEDRPAPLPNEVGPR